MGRKRILDLESYKFTLNVHGDNKIPLDILTEELGEKYGPVINMIISTFCNMPKDIKAEFLDFCRIKIEEIEKIQKVAEKMEYQELQRKKEYYQRILKIVNVRNALNDSKKVEHTKKIPLKNGCLYIPGDWILLNPEDAENCEYAGVVECRNSYLYKIPHFVFFTQDFASESETFINELCVKTYPKFREIMKMQVEPIPDPEKKGHYLNEKEFFTAPIIGHFLIPEKEEVYKSKLEYNAMIVREKGEK